VDPYTAARFRRAATERERWIRPGADRSLTLAARLGWPRFLRRVRNPSVKRSSFAHAGRRGLARVRARRAEAPHAWFARGRGAGARFQAGCEAGSSAIGGSELGHLVPDGDRTGPLAEAPPAVGAHPMASHAPHGLHVSHVSEVGRAGGNRGAWAPATNSGVRASEAARDITHATTPSCPPADRWHRPSRPPIQLMYFMYLRP
jgi:hypothetical protein